MTRLAPLDDPRYVPVHPPVGGRVPEVVARWGPRSQVRWFRRFREQVGSQPIAVWDEHYCASEHHRGQCCSSCFGEYLDGHGAMMDAWCCCRDGRGREKW